MYQVTAHVYGLKFEGPIVGYRWEDGFHVVEIDAYLIGEGYLGVTAFLTHTVSIVKVGE